MTNAPATPPPPPSGPALSGRDINLAASATRRVLIAALAPFDVTFEQWTVINQLGAGTTTDERTMRDVLGRGLQLTGPETDDLFDSLSTMATRSGSGTMALTDTGHELYAQGSAIVIDIVAQLYAGFSPDDLQTVHDVLSELTLRAESRLAAA